MPKEIKKPFSRPSPYPSKPEKINNVNLSDDDEQHWEQIICPICLDPPHNPTLLSCSSYGTGCRPYMCHSCLGQFRKSSPPRGYFCPLCRGRINGEVEVSSGLCGFLNAKPRVCSRESCEIRGTYEELTEHTRKDHADDVAAVVVDSGLTGPVTSVGRRPRIRAGYIPRRQLAARSVFA